jgi:hypothetical protein
MMLFARDGRRYDFELRLGRAVLSLSALNA